MSEENVEIVRRTWEHYFSTGELLDVTPDFVWDMSSFRGWPGEPRYQGAEGVQRFLQGWSEPFDELSFEVESYRDAGDEVVTVLRQHGRARASGVPVDMRYAVVTTVARDGLQTHAAVYADPDEALEAVGLEE